MSTRSILGLIYLVQGLQKLGEDPEPALQRHGLSLAKLDPSTRIERSRELRLYADLAEGLHDPLIGLKLGGFYGLAGYGPLVMLLMTCATVYDSLQVGLKYQKLTYLFGTLRFEPGDKLSALVLSPLRMDNKAFRFRTDGEVAGTYKMLRDMQTSMGMSLHPERVDMPYPRPPEAAAYEAHFGCAVRFDEHEARFWVRNEHLHVKLPTADLNAHQMYRSLCDQQLAAQEAQAQDTVVDRVNAHLGLYKGDYPDVEQVARALGLSERSLRRALADEGRNFRDLLAEAAAFIHAFQRWAGQTPRAYRQGSEA